MKYLTENQIKLVEKCYKNQMEDTSAKSNVAIALQQLYMVDEGIAFKSYQIPFVLWQLGWINPESQLYARCDDDYNSAYV